jgi:predicted ATP-dependent Lon-type protease
MATVIKPKRSETALAVPSSGSLEVGELALNVTDGKFYTKTSGNAVKEVGGAGSVTLQDVMTNGATTITDLVLDQGASLVFEGNLANSYETFLTVAEPTADRTITLPNQSGTVAMDGDALAYAIVFGG